MEDPRKLYAYFLGPKAENAAVFEAFLLDIVRDVVFWRRNYFPGDPPLLTRLDQRGLENEFDELQTRINEMLAELRRSFPFHSPRYMGHMLSDVSIPALLGAVAGMLYNPNNCTPEAAPVTTGWEIDACDEILRLLGYRLAPTLPDEKTNYSEYVSELRREFGWAHLTSGGTLANIEALWVARTVRYFPLAARDVARREGLDIQIKLPSDPTDIRHDIRDLTEQQVLLVKPNESIYLLSRFVAAVRDKLGITIAEAATKGTEWLKSSDYSVSGGLHQAAAQHPPCILSSGPAHYSVGKAADVLGIGRDNVILVDIDSHFRMDPNHLRHQIQTAVGQGRVPIAVVATAGTTEEGAVDPVHRILEVRRELETRDVSFWLHIDAAWGGYFRTLFRLSPEAERDLVLRKVGERLGIPFGGDLPGWHANLSETIDERSTENPQHKRAAQRCQRQLAQGLEAETTHEYLSMVRQALLAKAVREFLPVTGADFKPELIDRVDRVRRDVTDTISLGNAPGQRLVRISWSDSNVCQSFLSFPEAESVAIDPHKMGYIGYSCGAIAYRNDRVRHFMKQEAPYVTDASHNALIHHPIRHLVVDSEDQWEERRVHIDAVAPFTLEGSRAGSSAAALHLSSQVLPLSYNGHGQIVRASVLAALELYEWLRQWPRIRRQYGADNLDVMLYQPDPPDTNVVIFAVKSAELSTIDEINSFTRAVYGHFSISAEQGARDYSYAQPFFLSCTSFAAREYPYRSLKAFFERYGVRNAVLDYQDLALVALRASVMNPYMQPLRRANRQSLTRDFMYSLRDAAAAAGLRRVP
jgi:glutamate/tyrosine decarboxylase-like PLP-dependent enzyme